MERRSFDREFREGAVRIVRETGKPIAQVARELGLNAGTLGRWVNLDQRAREGEGPLSESERAEAAAQGKRRAGDGARCAQTLGRPLGQGSDAAVSLAALIAAQRARYGIPHAVSCRALGVSQAWFYKWRTGDDSTQRHRRKALAATTAWLFTKHRGTYGSPRITADLHDMGWRVSENTVAKLMAEQGLVARRKRRRRGTTKPDKSARKAPDRLRRNFAPPAAPNVAWVGDLTEIPTDEGKLQLAAVLDLHSRRVPGFAMGIHHDAALARAGAVHGHRGARRQCGRGDLPHRPGRRIHR
jgi:transposase-like protein